MVDAKVGPMSALLDNDSRLWTNETGHGQNHDSYFDFKGFRKKLS